VIELQEPEQELYNNMKPPFSYYGGKQRLAKRIVKLLPPHTVYVEPFCGSAAVYFKKGLPPLGNSHYYREVLNDTNGHIINFFRVLQNKHLYDHLNHRLNYTLYSQDDQRLSNEILKNDSADDLSRAWAWFVNVNNSSANNYGRSTPGYSKSGENHPKHFLNKVDRLNDCVQRMRSVYLFNEPALKTIDRFDAPQTCFYIDPPYPGTDQGHYGGFLQSDFDELINVLDSLTGAIVLSCYKNASVPDHWIKHEIDASSSANNRNPVQGKSRTECVWIKPASAKMRDDLYVKALEHYKHFQSI
jgi:DNA adenine methylase